MSGAAPTEDTVPTIVPVVQRALVLLVQGSLVLPFATVRSCGGGREKDLLGLEVFFGPDGGGIGLLLVGVVALLVAWPWTGDRSPAGVVGLGLRSWAAFGGVVVAVVGPALAFLFDTVEPRIGWWILGVGWAVIFFGYFVLALVGVIVTWRPPEAGGPPEGRVWATLATLVVAPFLAAGIHGARDPGFVGVVFGGAVGLVAVAPLVVTGLALLSARRAGATVTGQRVAWWLLVVATLLSHVGAAIAD